MPAGKPKKRKRAEFQGPDDQSIRRAPGFELPPATSSSNNPSNALEKHTDFFSTPSGLIGTSCLVQGPFSPVKAQRTVAIPEDESLPAFADGFSLPEDDGEPFIDPDLDALSTKPRPKVITKHTLEGQLWDDSDADISEDEDTQTGGKDGKGAQKARRTNPSVCTLFSQLGLRGAF